jgi:RHS repeat-associated protein
MGACLLTAPISFSCPTRLNFDVSDTFTGTVEVTAANSINQYQASPFTVIRDAAAPIVSVTAPTRTVSGVISVQWGAEDSVSGPTGVYTVSVITDTGSLQVWFAGTTQTSATFTPTFGHRYTFVVSATDWVSNTGQSSAATEAVQVTKYYYIGSSRVALRRGTLSGSEVTYLHTDHLGTVSIATNANAQVLARTLNLPYGGVRWSSGSMPTDYAFTGMKEPVGTGLVYLHARFYASSSGRFVSADTIIPQAGNPQTLNRYSYVLNSPLKFVDPTGHYPSGCAGNPQCMAWWQDTLVNFEGDWPDARRDVVLSGAWAVAEQLANIVSERQLQVQAQIQQIPVDQRRNVPESWSLSSLWGLSSRETFHAVLGNITFVRSDEVCATCWAETHIPNITVYANAFAANSYLQNGHLNTAHELGHAFAQRTGWDRDAGNYAAYAHLEATWDAQPAFPRRPDNPAQMEGGFAGTYPGWQQSTGATPNEVFADMFLGFTYGQWSTVNVGDADALSDWMRANMPYLISLAVSGD